MRRHPQSRTLILSYSSAPYLATLLIAARAGDEDSARKAGEKLATVDPAAATLAPILYAPYADRVEITTPWLEDIRIYSPLIIHDRPETLLTLLRKACERGVKVALTTRSGAYDAPEAAAERLRIIAELPGDCLETRISERIHTKQYTTIIGDITISVLTTANLTASEVWKTRTGDNKTTITVTRVK